MPKKAPKLQWPDANSKEKIRETIKQQWLGVLIIIIIVVGYGGYQGYQKLKAVYIQQGASEISNILYNRAEQCQLTNLQRDINKDGKISRDEIRNIVDIECVNEQIKKQAEKNKNNLAPKPKDNN